MSNPTSKIGTDVEVVVLQKISGAKEYSDGTPVLEQIDTGLVTKNVVPKEVEYHKVTCDECDGVVLEYDEHVDAVCPNCGLLAGDEESGSMWSDRRSAGRPIPNKGGGR
jgi:PHP family Zn ribbon phosphoesterase